MVRLAVLRIEFADEIRFRLPFAPCPQVAGPFGPIPFDPIATDLHELSLVAPVGLVPAATTVFPSRMRELNEATLISHLDMPSVPTRLPCASGCCPAAQRAYWLLCRR